MDGCRIMTFDGGGVRGALTARVLSRLSENIPNLLKRVNMFAGTSTGSLIALGLAAGIEIEWLDQLYSVELCRYIFKRQSRGLTQPRYSLERLQKVLELVFPSNLKLKDLEYNVLIPAFKVKACPENRNSWGPVFFSNLSDADDQDARVIDAALASCAAPIFFPSHQNYIDGAVVANNPSTIALAYALSRLSGREDLPKMSLISLGTGYLPKGIQGNTADWGAWQWYFGADPPMPLVSLLFSSAAQTDCLVTDYLLGKRYYRLNPLLHDPIGMDKYSKIPQLKRLADQFDLTPVLGWLHSFW